MKNKNICWPSTIYALLLYLLYAEDKDICETRYIFSKGFPKGIAERVKYGYLYQGPCQFGNLFIDWLILRLYNLFTLPFLHKNDKLYIQDHNQDCIKYIYNHEYVLLEDAPEHSYYILDSGKSSYGNQILSTINRKVNGKTTFVERLCDFLYSPLQSYPFGSNSKAVAAILSVDDPSRFLQKKKKIILPKFDNNYWMSFSELKRKKILEIYDLTNNDLDIFRNAKYVFLTQPLYPDFVTQDEHIKIIKTILSNYDINKVLIKTHPRDNLDYSKFFPGIAVSSKPIPVQLFSLLGVEFERAITVFSTSVYQFSCEIDWYGSEMSENLFKSIGYIEPPQGANIIKM